MQCFGKLYGNTFGLEMNILWPKPQNLWFDSNTTYNKSKSKKEFEI